MVSTIPSYQAAGVKRSVSVFSLSFVDRDVWYVVIGPALENRYQSTMDTHLRGGSCFSGKLTRGATVEALDEELL